MILKVYKVSKSRHQRVLVNHHFVVVDYDYLLLFMTSLDLYIPLLLWYSYYSMSFFFDVFTLWCSYSSMSFFCNILLLWWFFSSIIFFFDVLTLRSSSSMFFLFGSVSASLCVRAMGRSGNIFSRASIPPSLILTPLLLVKAPLSW